MRTEEAYHIRTRWIVLVAVAVLLGLWRVGQMTGYAPLWNFTPMGAVALFCGAYLRRRGQAFILPIFLLLVSDFLMSQTVYAQYGTEDFLYKNWYWTYVAFGLMVLIGRGLVRRLIVWRIAVAGIGVALIHWLISDIGPCFGSREAAALNWASITSCYAAAIPWSARLLYGTWMYSLVIFGGYALLIRYVPAVAGQKK